jgi:hypothetical protein
LSLIGDGFRGGARAASTTSSREGVSRRSPRRSAAASRMRAPPDAAPAAPSPRQCRRPCLAQIRPPGGEPATSSEARAPNARARTVRGPCQPGSSLLAWVSCPGTGRGRPVRATSCRPPGECRGAVGLYGVDQPGDHRKERQRPLPLTRKAVVSFTSLGPRRPSWQFDPAMANSRPSPAASGCSDFRTRTCGGGLRSWLGVDGVRLLAGGERS